MIHSRDDPVVGDPDPVWPGPANPPTDPGTPPQPAGVRTVPTKNQPLFRQPAADSHVSPDPGSRPGRPTFLFDHQHVRGCSRQGARQADRRGTTATARSSGMGPRRRLRQCGQSALALTLPPLRGKSVGPAGCRTSPRYPLRPLVRARALRAGADNSSMYTRCSRRGPPRSSVATSAATAVADMCSHDTRAPRAVRRQQGLGTASQIVLTRTDPLVESCARRSVPDHPCRTTPEVASGQARRPTHRRSRSRLQSPAVRKHLHQSHRRSGDDVRRRRTQKTPPRPGKGVPRD